MRVGGTKPSIVDVRIIAATNKDLAREVSNGNFREDLYFRLKSINLHIPPLRERKIDIKILFEYFVTNFCQQNNIQFAGIDDDAMDYIMNYVWLGNARELKNFCESIIVLNPNKRISLEDVKKHLQPEKTDKLIPQPIQFRPREQAEKDFLFRALLELKADIIDIKNAIHNLYLHNLKESELLEPEKNGFTIEKDKILNMTMDDLEKEVLIYLLRQYKWDIEAIAHQLKQTPRNIYVKIKKYNIDKRDFF
jgi:DNA-binding NtrC family response regulator